MKKIIILFILITIVTGCIFFDQELRDEVHRENKERGRVCEEDYKGYYHCYFTK